MASWKRQSQSDDRDRDGQAPGNKLKRRQGDSKQREIRTIGDFIKGPWMNAFVEPFLRKVVKDEVQTTLQRHLYPRSEQNPSQTDTSEGRDRGRAFQLRFIERLPREIYTGNKVVAEDGAELQIELCDATSRYCRVKDGPLSSLMIELYVLNGDFCSNGREDWTPQEFTASTMRQTRKGGQLLCGDKFVRLINGVGRINQVSIMDISRWARTGKFRLGAKIVDPTRVNIVREGKSEPFQVKDIRGESYKKHKNPSLNDEVWRLTQIARDGKRHKQLREHGIETVKDLLQLHKSKPHLFEKIMGKIGRKSIAKLIQHANAGAIQDCGNFHMYHTAQQPNVGQPYLPMRYLYSEHRGLVETAEQRGYQNLQAEGGLQQLDLPTASTSTPHTREAAHNEQLSIVNEVPDMGEISPDYIFSLLDGAIDDGAQCSYLSPYAKPSVYTSNKGRGTTVWDDIRNAVKFIILRLTKRKPKLVPCDY